MSIQSNMLPTEVHIIALDLEGNPKTNTMGEPTGERGQLEGGVLCSISFSVANNISRDINYSEISHIGLTACRTLTKGTLLKQEGSSYLIEKVPNNKTRLTTLYLKEVVN